MSLSKGWILQQELSDEEGAAVVAAGADLFAVAANGQMSLYFTAAVQRTHF